jgi:predicted RNA methylase
VVAGCGVLALVLSTIGVYDMFADTSDQDAFDLVEPNGIGRTIMPTRPCRQWWP